MRKVYSIAPAQNDALGIAFIFMGFMVLAFHESVEAPIFGFAWGLVLGIGIIVMGRLTRYEITDTEIKKFDGIGRLQQSIPWREVVRFTYDGKVGGSRNSFYRYTLTGTNSSICFYDVTRNWYALRDDIARRLPESAVQNSSSLALHGYPGGRSPRDLRRRKLVIVAFCGTWLIFVWALYILLPTGVSSQTSASCKVRLYQSKNGWIVRYTFSNQSRANPLIFDVEKTWLNGHEPQKYPRPIEAASLDSVTMDVPFAPDAASPDKPAQLTSWWQMHYGKQYKMSCLQTALPPAPFGPTQALKQEGHEIEFRISDCSSHYHGCPSC